MELIEEDASAAIKSANSIKAFVLERIEKENPEIKKE
jgi:hypothetical protein